MTDEEFAKLFPDIKWPETSEGRDRTYLKFTKPRKFPADFFEPQIIKNPRFPLSIGSASNRVSTPRERFADVLYGIYSNDPEGRHRVDNLMNYADFFGGSLFGAYDAPRALGEGRYKDAALSGITAVAPFADKPTKLIVNALRRRGSASRGVNDITPSEIAEAQVQSRNQQTIAEEPPPSLDQPPSSLLVPKYKSQVPLYSAKRENPDDIDFKIPAMPWERSSPWIAPYPPLPRPPRNFSLDYSKEALFDAAGNLRNDVVDDAGNLLKDIEGRKLTAKIIAGRRRIGERDRALSPDDVYSILGRDINADILPVAKTDLLPGNVGQVEMYDPPIVKFWGDLPQDQVNTVLAHEMGHILEEIGGRIRTGGLEDELGPLYSELNTGRSGRPFLLPKHRGYPDFMAPRELAAEAFRAYDADPNMIKTVAPKTAAMLREYNPHPWFAKHLQHNGIPFGAAVGAGIAMTSQAEKSQAKSLPFHNRSSSVDLNAIKSKGGMRKIAAALQASRLAPMAPFPNTLALIAGDLLTRRTASPRPRQR